MSIDRAELAGTGAALAFHVALVAALSLHLAQVDAVPEPPSMEVEFVDEVALSAAAPTPAVTPPPPSQAPEIGEAQPIEPAPAPAPTPTPTPQIEPAPAPRVVPTPAPRPAKAPAKPTPAKAAPAKPATAKPAAAKAAPAKPAPRVSRIGDDFLKGIDEAPARAAPRARAAAATFDANALASIQQAIRRQVQPCADRQVDPGPGANRIRVTLNIRLNRSGRLLGPPRVVRTSGVDDENSRYEQRVEDLAVAAYTGCAPLTGLPPDLYQTEKGGWSNINMTYRLP